MTRSELLDDLFDPRTQRVRKNVIAHQTCTEVVCPHCSADVGSKCVTFPRGEPAVFPHMKRVHARIAQMDAKQEHQSIREARGWIADCTWAEELDVEELTDLEVIKGVDKHYDGGWEAFLRDC